MVMLYAFYYSTRRFATYLCTGTYASLIHILPGAYFGTMVWCTTTIRGTMRTGCGNDEDAVVVASVGHAMLSCFFPSLITLSCCTQSQISVLQSCCVAVEYICTPYPSQLHFFVPSFLFFLYFFDSSPHFPIFYPFFLATPPPPASVFECFSLCVHET